MMYEWMDGGIGWGGMFLGPLFMVAVVALIAYVVILLVRAASGSDARERGPDKSATEILAERYARGEIDTAEFEERKRQLNG